MQGLTPTNPASSQGKPELSRHFDYIRRCSAGMAGPRYALSHTKGRYADFHRVAFGARGEFLQRKAHCSGQYRTCCFSLSLRGLRPFAQGCPASGFIDAPLDCHGSIPLSLDDGETSYLYLLGILCGSGRTTSSPMPTLEQAGTGTRLHPRWPRVDLPAFAQCAQASHPGSGRCPAPGLAAWESGRCQCVIDAVGPLDLR